MLFPGSLRNDMGWDERFVGSSPNKMKISIKKEEKNRKKERKKRSGKRGTVACWGYASAGSRSPSPIVTYVALPRRGARPLAQVSLGPPCRAQRNAAASFPHTYVALAVAGSQHTTYRWHAACSAAQLGRPPFWFGVVARSLMHLSEGTLLAACRDQTAG